MKLYFAGGLGSSVLLQKCGIDEVLSSWLERNEQFYSQFDIFLDSGAFSAWTRGVNISVDEYIDYIKKHENELKVYATLDVIGDAEATYQNHLKMKEAGLHPIPAFHVYEDFKYLERYLETEDYIALGGLVGRHRNVLEPFLDNCFARIKDYWPKKIHGFGLTAAWAMQKYPFYSVDSTGWLSGARFGQLDVDGKKHTRASKTVLGMKLHTEDYKVISEIAIKSYQQKIKYITDLWETRGITWQD